MQFLYTVIRTLLLLALLPWPSRGQFHVIGPKAPITVLVSKEAVLSCHLEPVMDAQNMEVRWHRKEPSGLVYRYGTSQDYLQQQMAAYQGRTEFLKENITKGQVALRIHSISPFDDGSYSCFFESSTYYEEAHFEVLVTASGVAPHIHIEPGNTKEVKLTCTSTGWYPEPEVQWRDLQGLRLIPESAKKRKEGNGLFHVETSVTVDKTSRGIVSCIIRNPILNEEKEVHISVADALFPRNSPWIVVLAVLLSLLLVAAAFGAVYIVRVRKAKEYLLKEKDDLERERENLMKESENLRKEKERAEKENDEISKYLDSKILLGIEGLKEARRYQENIVLDKMTAHPCLQVSEDGKSVNYSSDKQKLSNNPERFDTLMAVLGKNIFSDGSHYWEVSIARKNNWTIGLCVDSTPRKGQKISAAPENGLWTVTPKDVKPRVTSISQSVSESPLTVGIFLQYDKGKISFYNVTDSTISRRFKGKFTQPLLPYFQLNDKGSGTIFTILTRRQQTDTDLSVEISA